MFEQFRCPSFVYKHDSFNKANVGFILLENSACLCSENHPPQKRNKCKISADVKNFNSLSSALKLCGRTKTKIPCVSKNAAQINR